MRLIDADALSEHVFRDRLDSRELIQKMVDDAPTIDAVPVVRCRDCKHRPMDNYEAPTGEDGLADDVCPYICMTDNWYTGIPDDDSFCDKGERKDGDYNEG